MMIQELQRGMVNRRITITEQEIDNFLNSEMGREVMSPDFLLTIWLSLYQVPIQTKSSKKLRFAANLVAKVEDGSNFLEIRAEAGESSSYQIQSTDFGWRKAGAATQFIFSIVVEMDEGEVAGPIEAGNGYHVIFLA